MEGGALDAYGRTQARERTSGCGRRLPCSPTLMVPAERIAMIAGRRVLGRQVLVLHGCFPQRRTPGAICAAPGY